ncbi:MAG: DUF4157 domain-containing protein [Bacteroidota bacterium]
MKNSNSNAIVMEQQHLSHTPEQQHASPLSESGFDTEGGFSAAPPPFQLMADDAPSPPNGNPGDPPPKVNNTGLPDDLKAGIENMSGFGMDDVKVHYNSDKPSQLQAHAYAQGTDIPIGPGQ